MRIRIPFKRKKGRNEPKQPDTAYICFWKTKRLEVLDENPDMEASFVSKEVGRRWKCLPDEERQVSIADIIGLPLRGDVG